MKAFCFFFVMLCTGWPKKIAGLGITLVFLFGNRNLFPKNLLHSIFMIDKKFIKYGSKQTNIRDIDEIINYILEFGSDSEIDLGQ